MVVLFIERRGVREEGMTKPPGEEVSDDEAQHEGDEAGGHDGRQQRLRAVDVAVSRLHSQQICNTLHI